MCLDGAETERLRIRKFNKSDVDTWTLFFQNNPSLDYLGLDLSQLVGLRGNCGVMKMENMDIMLWSRNHQIVLVG
jgi:hypothetical protein